MSSFSESPIIPIHYFLSDTILKFLSSVENAAKFNADLSTWSVERVFDMAYMFHGASSFNSNLASWNVSSLIDMSSMFSAATSFRQNLCDWGVFLDTSALVMEAFNETACPRMDDPNLNMTPPDLFCFSCEEVLI